MTEKKNFAKAVRTYFFSPIACRALIISAIINSTSRDRRHGGTTREKLWPKKGMKKTRHGADILIHAPIQLIDILNIRGEIIVESSAITIELE